MTTSTTSSGFGAGIDASIGFLSSTANGKGWQNGFGANIIWLPPSYVSYSLLSELLTATNSNVNSQFGAASLYYKGIRVFNDHLDLTFRFILPLFMWGSFGGVPGSYSVLNVNGMLLSATICGITPSVGFRIKF